MRRAALWLLGGLIGLSVIYVDPRAYDCFRRPRELVTGYGLTVLACLLAAGRLAPDRRPVPRRRVWLPLSLLAGWSALSLAWSASPRLTLEATGAVLLLGVLALACATLAARPAEARNLALAFLIPLVPTAAYAIFQYYGFDPLFDPARAEYHGRWVAVGLVGQATLFGAVLGIGLPFLISLLLIGRRPRLRSLAALAVLITVVAILCTHTRAVFLGLLLVLPGFALALRHWAPQTMARERPFLVGTAAGALLLALIFMAGNPTLGRRVRSAAELGSSSITARLFYWEASAELVRDRPWGGTGAGTFALVYPAAQSKVLARGSRHSTTTSDLVHHPHNELVKVAVELGLVGVGLMLWLAGAAAADLVDRLRAQARERDRVLTLGLAAGVAVGLVDAMFSFPLHVVPSALAMIAGAALAIGSWGETSAGGRA